MHIELKQTIETLFPTYLDFWKTICTLETPSAAREALNLQADVIEKFSKERGFSVTRQSHPKAGDTMTVTLFGYADQAPVALLAHMDTVHAPGAFGCPIVREKDGILYGPGVFDCKGGIVACLMAMEALSKTGIGHRTVKLILNSDEENGSFVGASGIDYIHNEAKGAVAAFNAEAGRTDSLTVGRKGIMAAEIEVSGIASHAGNAYYQGASAIREAAYKIIALEGKSDDNVTFNCGLIQGGTVRNIVPESCKISVDVRFQNADQQKQAAAIMEEITNQIHVEGCTATWKIIKIRPAMECTEGNMKLFGMVAETAKELGLPALQPMKRGGGSDSCYTVEIGIPTVCSMGPAGLYEHTVKEQADIDSLPQRANLLAECILKV